MDSIALAFWKKPKYAFTIDYGQKPAKSEIQAARQVSSFLGIEHYVVEVDCSKLGSGDLSNRKPIDIAPISEWWPYRNQLLVTLACMKGVSLGVDKLYVGSVKSDDCHIDGTKEFYHLLNKVMSYQEGNVSILTPSIELSTLELIRQSKIPTSIIFWAHSCHTSNSPCMHCNGCKKYLYVLQELNLD